MIKRLEIAVLLILTVYASHADDDKINLSVLIDGGKSETGQITATLFDSEKNYMKNPTASRSVAVNEDGKAQIIFEKLTPGEYAVTVYYDEDSDGKLDKNLFGIPKEKVGFSNNAKPRMGPAPYKKARFMLTPEKSKINITLKKAK